MKIEVVIPDNIYLEIEKVLEGNKVPRVDPENPKRTIVEPEFASVEAWIEAVVEQNCAPIASRISSTADVAAIEAQLAELQAELAAKRKVVSTVTKKG